MTKRLLVGIAVVLGVFWWGSIFPGRKFHHKNNDGGKAYGEEIKTIELPKEYLEAYDLFLKANATDAGEYTYDKAIEKLKKIIATTENQDIKLRCYFLISFSSFLQGDFSMAYKMGIEGLSLAKTRLAENPKTVLLDKIKQAVENKEITDISGMVAILSLGEEGNGLVYDLAAFHSRYEDQQELVEKCWKKYSPAFEKSIKTLLREGFSQKETDTIRQELEKKYMKMGFIHPSTFETEILAYKEKFLKGRLDALIE